MRKILMALLVLLVFIGLSAALPNFGPSNGFQNRGTIVALQGFDGSEVANDAGDTDPLTQVVVQTWATPELADADQLLNDEPMNQTTNMAKINFAGTIDYPRTITVTMSATTTAYFKITGTDIHGSTITENLTVTGGTAATGTKAFKTVTLINADLLTGESDKTVDIGISDILGLDFKLGENTVLMATKAGTKEGTAPTVTVSSTVLSSNTIDLNSALAGTEIKAWYMV